MAAPAPEQTRPHTQARYRLRLLERTAATGPAVRGPHDSAVAGVLAAALALGVCELFAGLVPGVPSLVVAVGGVVVDGVPKPVKDLAIGLFGTADKPALLIGILLVSALAGALIGRLAARRFTFGVVGIALFGALGAAATLGDPQASVLASVCVALLGVGAGIAALRRLLDVADGARPAGAAGPGARAQTVPAAGRRQFLSLATGVGVAAVLGAVAGRALESSGNAVRAARDAVSLPRAARPLRAIPADRTAPVDGVVPFVSPNDGFYRIDTALVVPRVDPATWRMGITGLVRKELSFSLDELLAMELVEADITLCCVSNEVGGDLIGNARWLGVRLDSLLERAGVDPRATQVVGHSVDGWTAGFPAQLALDGRDALVAVGMNGEPLPMQHGFPARLVVPGVYGYVSATKWLDRIELTTWEAFDGYWVPRGWSKEGPIKTQSRIDVPRSNARVAAGRTAVAGIAWAQHTGIDRVEVAIDGGAWQEANLAAEQHVDTWRQWWWDWDATPGEHVLAVRATDRTHTTQLEERRPVAPDGATGYHTVRVQVA